MELRTIGAKGVGTCCGLLAMGMALSGWGAAAVLQVRREPNTIVLDFTGRLQSASRVQGPYTNVPGTSPYRWPVLAESQRFWRAWMPGVKTFATGGEHTIALQADGSLWGWGYNFSGQLGNGTWADTNSPTRIGADTDWQAVACGAVHSVALKSDGSLWAWGDNLEGQLGHGTFVWNTNVPTRIGGETDWKEAACSGGHTVALKSDGSLWGWGIIDFDGPNYRTNAPTRIGAGKDWQAVACGYAHTAASTADGGLWTWGENLEGQLGHGTLVWSTNAPVRIGRDVDWQGVACGYFSTVAIKADQSLFGWGLNLGGQLAQPVPWLPYPVLGGNRWGPGK